MKKKKKTSNLVSYPCQLQTMKSTGLPEVTQILYLFFRKLPFYIDFLFVCLCVCPFATD